MRELQIRTNEASYVGVFSEPAFDLLGQAGVLVASAYKALRPFNVGLDAITVDPDPATAAAFVVRVRLGARSEIKIRVDRLEATLRDYLLPELDLFPSAIQGAAEAVRGMVEGHAFQTHALGFIAHGEITGLSSEEYLTALSSPPDLGIGVAEGHGLVYNYRLSDRPWTIKLYMDHSVAVTNGLFVRYTVIVPETISDLAETAMHARQTFRAIMNRLDLNTEVGNVPLPT